MLGSSMGDGTVLETPSGTEKGLENAGAGAATVTATADTGRPSKCIFRQSCEHPPQKWFEMF